MVALWIRAGEWLVPGALGVRLLGPLSAAAGSLLLADAANRLFPGRRAGLVAAVLLNSTLMLGAGAVIMTPDTPLIFFWTLGMWAMARLVATGQERWWLAAGLAAGLAMDSKYTGALFLAAVGAWVLLLCGRRGHVAGQHDPGFPDRCWMTRPLPYLGLALALTAFLPTLWWNAGHGWASLMKQGGRTGDWHPARAWQFLGELLGGQIGLATPLIFLLMLVGTARLTRRWRDPGAALVAALVIVPAVVFLQHALGDRVQANWPCVLYPAASIAAASLSPTIRAGQWWRPAAVLGLGLTGLVYVQASLAVLPLPGTLDVVAMRLGGWSGWARQAEAARQDAGADYLAADDYGIASELAWHLPGTMVIGVEPRWRWFNLPPGQITNRIGLLVREARHGPPDPAKWTRAVPMETVIRRQGEVAVPYQLYRVSARGRRASARLP